jgi:CHAT domain-containing protein
MLAANYATRYQATKPGLAAGFIILEAESAAWRGMSDQVVILLSPPLQVSDNSEIEIRRHSLLGLAYSHLHQYSEADQQFKQAEALCSTMDAVACGGLLRARGGNAIEHGQLKEAYQLFAQSLSSARRFKQPMDEATALMNLGYECLLEERFDEAIDWSHAADHVATELLAGDILLNTQGNLGWAYYKLGDAEKALGLLEEAEQRAVQLGDPDDAIAWLTTAGFVYENSENSTHAVETYRQALKLAMQINSKESIIDILEDLAHVSAEAGRLDEASAYIAQVTPLVRANGNRLDALDVILAQGKIAAARRQDQQAEELFHEVEHDPASQTSMRFGAEHQLARLYEVQGHADAARGMYRTALATFESARDQLKNEDSKLPFLANATRIYDDYIHFLVTQGRTDEALAAADQSRARTLAQGLGITARQQSLLSAPLSPRAVARKEGATLLFYWLGGEQSYLWTITPEKTVLFPLPAQREITPLIERYRKAVLGTGDPLALGNTAGQDLYGMLVAPAAKLIRPDVPVMILADGALSLLNFETLLVPGQLSGRAAHYWIEDATLISAPSLAMLAAAKPATVTTHDAAGKLLLLGDAVSPGEEYPELRYASLEMKQVEKHFSAGNEVVFARGQATPESYLASEPKQFSYIHFVSHGVASRMDPLDSAIILSRAAPLSHTASATATGATGAEDSFKLYAREVMRHPIDARLVTISACYGSGTRAYAGEGLVGLSWAFLRAGAHNVVGALWEASDNSTPLLMDTLYKGLEDGQSPAAALRQAKLALLHSESNFRKPFYWAPFQIYTRM